MEPDKPGESNESDSKRGGGNKYYKEYLKCLKKYKQLKMMN